MNGANRSRSGSKALRKRCPCCNKLRKFCEPDGNHGRERHDRRPEWLVDITFNNRKICGWCYARRHKIATVCSKIKRCSKTGRIIKEAA